jgi:hypothetical protein
MYFKMPEWVQDWNSIVEDESHPDDFVKAFKRYLNNIGMKGHSRRARWQ